MNKAVKLYVAGVTIAAIVLLWLMVPMQRPPIDAIALLSLVLVATLLEVSRTANKSGSMAGSLVFVMHFTAGVALGGLPGALIAAGITAATQAYSNVARLKILFNVSERILSVGIAFCVYYLLGGKHPPPILEPGSVVPFADAILQVARFLAAAVVYFVINSIAVNTAVALATGKRAVSMWKANTFWVLGHDMAASFLALAVAYLFVKSEREAGLGKLWFVGVFLPFIYWRGIYGKLNTLQDLFTELDEAYAQLEINVREQLDMMVKAIEARDPYTSGHSRRVSSISRAIATDLGLDQEHVEQIYNAALLHDVGKIHEEFAPLLQKEGKLTDEEWAIMKTHSIKSADLVSSFSRFQGYVVSCVRHHHERWDGRGYPDGISAEAIPLGARIITIADTIDAMTTNRPYRSALSLDVVLGELNRGRGTQFDESLVELTVNSVTVRRLISDPSAAPEIVPQPRIRARAEAAIRREKFVPSKKPTDWLGRKAH